MSVSFSVIVADPPWSFSDKLKMSPVKRGADANYTCMSTQDLCHLKLPNIADDALLFLWRVASMQQEAMDVMDAWGFKLKSELVWIKTTNDIDNKLTFGMGNYVRNCHETCLIGVRGKGNKLIKNHSIRSVFLSPRQKHSQKPNSFFTLVEDITGKECQYLELFSRQAREGWTTLGDELGSHIPVKNSDMDINQYVEKMKSQHILADLKRQKIKYELMLGQEFTFMGSAVGSNEEMVRKQIAVESKMSDPEIMARLDELDREIKQVKIKC